MIYIYLNTISPSLSFQEELNKLPLLLQQRIIKKKQKQKQITSLCAYKTLQEALEKEFKLDLNSLSFTKNGKPFLENSVINFSISHSKNLVGVAISTQGIVGFDIEPFRNFDNIESAFPFFSPIEQEAILAAKNPNETLIEFWSKKEALVKLLGSQMFDIASLTDVRFLSTIWLENKYFFHNVSSSWDCQIWLSSSFPINSIILKELKL